MTDLPPIPEPLVRAILDGECVAFVGAGLSAGSGRRAATNRMMARAVSTLFLMTASTASTVTAPCV